MFGNLLDVKHDIGVLARAIESFRPSYKERGSGERESQRRSYKPGKVHGRDTIHAGF